MWKTGVCCGEYLKDNLNTGNRYVNQGKVNLCSCLIKKWCSILTVFADLPLHYSFIADTNNHFGDS